MRGDAKSYLFFIEEKFYRRAKFPAQIRWTGMLKKRIFR